MLLEIMLQDRFFKKSFGFEEKAGFILDWWHEDCSHSVELACADVCEYLITHKCRAFTFSPEGTQYLINSFVKILAKRCFCSYVGGL